MKNIIVMMTFLSIPLVSTSSEIAVANPEKLDVPQVREILRGMCGTINNNHNHLHIKGALLELIHRIQADAGKPEPAATPCAEIDRLDEGEICETAVGTTVKRTKRGDLEGIEINGKFWHKLRNLYTNRPNDSEAKKACETVGFGLRFPEEIELKTLRNDFGNDTCTLRFEGTFTTVGEREFRAVMPETYAPGGWSKSMNFWASPAVRADYPTTQHVQMFRADDGRFWNDGQMHESDKHSVLCVGD